ncbi:MAG: serine protease [Rhodocyclales bacterium GT-UBC]|nr:MAG: serine protease [Rhodocyclales bacterium GT-UBC]
MIFSKAFGQWVLLVLSLIHFQAAVADFPDAIQRIKPSIVVVGTYKKTDSPQFSLRGTGFAIGNGNLIATNAHVLPDNPSPEAPALVIQGKDASGAPTQRRAVPVLHDKDHDLAILRIDGSPFPPLKLRNSDLVKEGEIIGFTGFPIGGVLGFSPVTHRGMVSAITPIVLPGANAHQLNEKLILRIKAGAFNIFQLDATAYPGNSGSPVFDPESGEIVGIINMVFIKGNRESALSQPSGISYAIPSNYLRAMLESF